MKAFYSFSTFPVPSAKKIVFFFRDPQIYGELGIDQQQPQSPEPPPSAGVVPESVRFFGFCAKLVVVI